MLSKNDPNRHRRQKYTPSCPMMVSVPKTIRLTPCRLRTYRPSRSHRLDHVPISDRPGDETAIRERGTHTQHEIRGTIAITDHGWYERLRALPAQEVNFWKPSAARRFQAPEFSPFLFKLRAPHHAICGYAFFARYSVLPDWFAWETFGEANGTATFKEAACSNPDDSGTDQVSGRSRSTRDRLYPAGPADILSPERMGRPTEGLARPGSELYRLRSRRWRRRACLGCVPRPNRGHPPHRSLAGCRRLSAVSCSIRAGYWSSATRRSKARSALR